MDDPAVWPIAPNILLVPVEGGGFRVGLLLNRLDPLLLSFLSVSVETEAPNNEEGAEVFLFSNAFKAGFGDYFASG